MRVRDVALLVVAWATGGVMAYGTISPTVLQAIKQQPAQLQVPLLTTALIESGGNPRAVGDGGHSGGLYQENDWGRGHGIPMANRFDPVASTARAAREFQQYYGKGARGADLAYRAQRPADRGSYIQKYQGTVGRAQSLLGQPPMPDPSGGAPKPPSGALGGLAGLRDSVAQSILGTRAGETPNIIGAIMQNEVTKRVNPEAAAGEAVKIAEAGAPAKPTGPEATGVVGAAKSKLGTPYSWGGGTPSGPSRGFGRGASTVGFDCSSLVQYAWAKQGVQIPRTTYEQIAKLPPIPTDPSRWRPGDLLFPSSHHVQMYIGNGKVIEAPYTGGRVQIAPVRGVQYARRPGG